MCSCSSSADTPCALSWPPSQSVSSIRQVRQPRRAAASAAATPPIPPPATSTSQSISRSGAALPTFLTATPGSPSTGTRITSTTDSSRRSIALPRHRARQPERDLREREHQPERDHLQRHVGKDRAEDVAQADVGGHDALQVEGGGAERRRDVRDLHV